MCLVELVCRELQKCGVRKYWASKLRWYFLLVFEKDFEYLLFGIIACMHIRADAVVTLDALSFFVGYHRYSSHLLCVNEDPEYMVGTL